MNIKIGAIIKKLRTENSITQDTLATAIGVTPQAISRWESEGGYPDIELLPALADFFSVSTDELLGYKLSEREEELANIKKELRRLAEVGTHQEKLSFARDAFVKFPNDYKIKVYLAACLSDEWNNTHEKSLIHEAETLCLSAYYTIISIILDIGMPFAHRIINIILISIKTANTTIRLISILESVLFLFFSITSCS